MYLLDTSVIYKWFVEEENTQKALTIKEAHKNAEITISFPDLLIYELANALRYKNEFSPAEIRRCCQDLFDLNLDIIAPLPDTIEAATRIAHKNDITIYDAFYIALAQELEFQFITADEKLYNKVKDIQLVNLLSKFVT